MIAYFDSSALVKLVLDEPGSEIVETAWDGADVRATSRLAFPEVRAAFAAAERDRRLSPNDHRAGRRLLSRRASQIGIIELSAPVADAAGDLAQKFALTGADAVHLASGLVVSDEETIFLTWDRRLATGAAAAGLTVLPKPHTS